MEEGVGGHPGRWKPGVVGQEEVEGAAGVVQSHCPAAAAELGEHWNSQLLGEVGKFPSFHLQKICCVLGPQRNCIKIRGLKTKLLFHS